VCTCGKAPPRVSGPKSVSSPTCIFHSNYFRTNLPKHVPNEPLRRLEVPSSPARPLSTARGPSVVPSHSSARTTSAPLRSQPSLLSIFARCLQRQLARTTLEYRALLLLASTLSAYVGLSFGRLTTRRPPEISHSPRTALACIGLVLHPSFILVITGWFKRWTRSNPAT